MPESPPDAAPSIQSVALRPGYRSGTIIAVSVQRSFPVRGRLLGADGKPSSGRIGDLHSAAGKALGVATFTDEDGVFELYGIAAGSYSIQWEGGTGSAFTIADTELKEINIGNLVFVEGAISQPKPDAGAALERLKP